MTNILIPSLQCPTPPRRRESPWDRTQVKLTRPMTPEFDFTAVYTEHFLFVWKGARRLGVPEAALDDICQDVFFIIYRRLGEFEGRSSLRTWVYAILHHVVMTWRRRSRRKDPHRAETDPDLLAAWGDGPYEAVSAAQAVRIASALLASLGDDRRRLFVLVELEGLSMPEAAAATGTNLNTAYARLRAARTDFAAAVARFHAREHWRT